MILLSLVFKSDGVGHLRLDVPLASPPTAERHTKDKDKCTPERNLFFILFRKNIPASYYFSNNTIPNKYTVTFIALV